MNFTAGIVNTKKESDRQFIREQTSRLVEESKRTIKSVNDVLEKYQDNFVLESKILSLHEDVNSLNNEIDRIISKIETQTRQEINNSTSELIKHSQTLAETKYALSIYGGLLEINKYLDEYQQAFTAKQYVKAAKILLRTKSLVNNIPDSSLIQTITESINPLLIVNTEHLNYTLCQVWDDNVRYECTKDDRHEIVTVRINKVRIDETRQVLQVFHVMNTRDRFIQTFFAFLMDEILVPAMKKPVSVKTSMEDGYSILVCECNKDLKKLTYEHVFSIIKTVFEYLKLLDVEINDKALTFIGLFGDSHRDTFTSELVKHCLYSTVPSTIEQLKSYDKIKEQIILFQQALVQYHFYTTDFEEILSFARNIDTAFVDKICKIYQERADVAIKKDLHDSVETKTLSVKDFPPCCVSKSAVEIVNILKEIFELLKDSSDKCAGRLLCMAQNVLDSYGTLVPQHHKKLLEVIPQQAAIFYNNCLFIAHQASYLSQTHAAAITGFKNRTGSGDLTITSSRLLQLGKETFYKFRDEQATLLQEIINSSDLVSVGVKESLGEDVERAVRQCLRQLALLQTVWARMLPAETYCVTIGRLLDVLLDRLISCVLTAEDISGRAADTLLEAFSVVLDKAPRLFDDRDDVLVRTPLWNRFREVHWLLGAPLVVIEDRWADGKGPLALAFNATELRSLVRALFQNTDVRAKILSKIN